MQREIGMPRIREIMNDSENIRNIAVFGSEGSGWRTLIDQLISKAGIRPPPRQRRYYQDRVEQRVFEDIYFDSIDSSNSANTLCYAAQMDESLEEAKKRQCLITLIGLATNNYENSQVASTLRVTDGALLVIDAASEFSNYFQLMLKQSIRERVKHSLMINKIDASILDLRSNGEELYHYFSKVIQRSNAVIEHLSTIDKGQIAINPVENVVFGSAEGGWAFTISTFAHLYAKRFSIDINKMKEKLWGDNFFDSRKKKWYSTDKAEDGKPLKRSFVEFIMEPICKLCESLYKGEELQYLRTLHALNIQLSEAEKTVKGRKLVDLVMKKWLPLADCVLKMMIVNLPSPLDAQRYKTEYLYSGPNDDEVSKAINNCDPAGPLMVFISKMIPSKRQNNRFYAFGRVFSGTVRNGDKIKVMGPRFKPGKNQDLYEKRVQRLFYIEGHKFNPVQSVPCGNLVAIYGIDQNIIKFGSITNNENPKPFPIRTIEEKIVPVLKIFLSPKQPANLPRMIDGIKRLNKLNSQVIFQCQETGENCISGCSQEVLEKYCNILQDEYARCQIKRSQPIVIYKQVMTKASDKIVKAISANKHNRLLGTGKPLDAGYIDEVQEQLTYGNIKIDKRKEILCERYNWDRQTAEKIWFFGPEEYGSNILVNSINEGVKNSKEIRDSVCAAFQWSTKLGVLCDENMRGMKFNLVDCELHADAIHRGGGQMIPATRRLLFGIELLCQPTLVEPVYEYSISTTEFFLGSVYQVINQRRGIIKEVAKPLEVGKKEIVAHYHQIKAFISAKESIGFPNFLKENTKGNAMFSCHFDHWRPIEGLPFVDAKATELVMSIRKQKGLKEEVPLFGTYAEVIQ